MPGRKPSMLSNEIQFRIRKGYLDRLAPRIKRMRQLYASRNWLELQIECAHLKRTATRFGYPDLTRIAEAAEASLAVESQDREARKAVESLLRAADHILITDSNKH